MSVAVCRGPIVPAFDAPHWFKPAAVEHHPPAPARVDIWNAIQADVDKASAGAKKAAPPANHSNKPYVHPLVRRSSSRLMSQKSLEVCTESLGNETGSGDFTDMASLFDSSASPLLPAEESFWGNGSAAQDRDEEAAEECGEGEALAAVNYHRCSAVGARRSFPPPLPSMSRRDGRPCVQMRARREGGRLLVEAVAVRPRGYLHARRDGGRLRLAFVECSARDEQSAATPPANAAVEAPFFPAVVESENERDEDPAVETDDEEEVEVVDRGTVVELKVSTQPQTPSAGKVHRSRLVINKFVGGTPVTVDHPPQNHNNDAAQSEAEDDEAPTPKLRRVPSSTTTLAAAVAAASTGSDDDEPAAEDASAAAEPKQLLLFTSRRGDKQDLLQSVRRCRQLRQKPLFILEPYCIATS